MLKLLAIDTATEQCSAALLLGDACLVRSQQTARGHADLILPMVQSLLAEAQMGITQLDAIAFGRGPGAFTGVRLAIGVAQGLAFGAQLPVLPISDLAAIAQQGAAQVSIGARILVCMDARMGEVYAGQFELSADGLVVPVSAECVCAPEQVDVVQPALGLGMGWRAYPALRERYAALGIIDDALPHAAQVVRLAQRDWLAGHAINAALAAPVYLRNEVAHVKAS